MFSETRFYWHTKEQVGLTILSPQKGPVNSQEEWRAYSKGTTHFSSVPNLLCFASWWLSFNWCHSQHAWGFVLGVDWEANRPTTSCSYCCKILLLSLQDQSENAISLVILAAWAKIFFPSAWGAPWKSPLLIWSQLLEVVVTWTRYFWICLELRVLAFLEFRKKVSIIVGTGSVFLFIFF